MSKQEQARQKIDTFTHRFGDGHYAFACQAAFPIGFTPDLLYQLWANFKTFPKLGDRPGGESPMIAVSDLLLSPLCKQIARDVFEMDMEVRTLLLEVLRGEGFQQLNRMEEIACFVFQYLDHTKPQARHESLWETLYWNTLVTIEPERAFGQVQRKLAESVRNNNEGEIFRFRNLLESFSVQDKGIGQENNSRFYGLMNYTKLLKASLLDYPPEFIDQQLKQIGWVYTTDEKRKQNSIKLPILDKMVGTLEAIQPESEAPAELDIHAKEIFAILIGIDDYRDPELKLSGCLRDIEAYENYLYKRYQSDTTWDLYTYKLLNEQATVKEARELIERVLRRAGEEDFVFIVFCGHTYTGKDFTTIRLYDMDEGQDSEATKEKNWLSRVVQGSRKQIPVRNPFPVDVLLAGNTQTSIILSIDAVKSANVLEQAPKNVVFLASTGLDMQSFEERINGQLRGIYSYQLLETLQEGGQQTYRQLMNRVRELVSSGHAAQRPILICAEVNAEKHPFEEALAEGHPPENWEDHLLESMVESLRPYSEELEWLILRQEKEGEIPDWRKMRRAIIDVLPAPLAEPVRKLFAIQEQENDLRYITSLVASIKAALTSYLLYLTLTELWEVKHKNPDQEIPPFLLEEVAQSLADGRVIFYEHTYWVRIVRYLVENRCETLVGEWADLLAAYDRDAAIKAAFNFDHLAWKILPEMERAYWLTEVAGHLGVLFRHLAFIVQYPLVSIKDIQVVKSWKGSATFSHQLVRLDTITAGFRDEQVESPQFSANQSVTVQTSKGLEGPYLNLSPFVIDKAGLTGSELSKLFFFSNYDPKNDVLVYQYAYAGEETFDAREFPELREQFDEFCQLFFGKKLHEL